MRRPREKASRRGDGYCCESTIIGEEDNRWSEDEQAGLKRIIDEACLFYQVEVKQSCITDRDFHIVVWINPERPSMGIAKERMERYDEVTKQPGRRRCFESEDWEKLADQMVDISCFLQNIKQRFTNLYNRIRNRKGPSWVGRFKMSIFRNMARLFEPFKAAVSGNPDPSDSRWSELLELGPQVLFWLLTPQLPNVSGCGVSLSDRFLR